jgi:DNA-3-methyladenine glycosylase II
MSRPLLQLWHRSTPVGTFQIKPEGSFSLEQSRAFLLGFTPAAGSAEARDARLVLAFRLDKTFAPVAVVLTQGDDKVVSGQVFGGASVDAVQKQVARILALDHDGTDWDALVRNEGTLFRLLQSYPGFRPVSFPSPYEAAAWGVLAQRVPMRHAANVKRKLATEAGDAVDVEGTPMHVFPTPEKILSLTGWTGLPAEKWNRLQAVARAAAEGLLDADYLRSLSETEALEKLSEIHGVGAWTAGHILLRGTGAKDVFSMVEPRVFHAVALAYGMKKDPTEKELAEISDRWRPFRSWATVLVAVAAGRMGEWKVKTARKRGTAPSKRKSNDGE